MLAVPPHLSPRRLFLALALSCAVLALVGLIAPARGLAGEAAWAPAAASLAKAPRTCPSPSVATYYDTTCWTVSADHGNPFDWPQGPSPWGQCTYWALEMRPDLWNNRSDADPSAGDWTAYTWPRHAALEGLTVDHAPAVGAVIVWPQSEDNDTGHVGFVQSVSIAPSTGYQVVTLQEMNDTTFDDPSRGQGDTMTMAMDPADLAQVQFIHAPQSTPGPLPTTSAAGAAAVRASPSAASHRFRRVSARQSGRRRTRASHRGRSRCRRRACRRPASAES